MKHRRWTTTACLMTLALAAASAMQAQAGEETFSAQAKVTSAGGAMATAPVTIVVSRKMPREEAAKLTNAFTANGAAGLRKALAGVPPTGSVRIGNATPTPTRLTVERVTPEGRLLTIVTDQPLVFVGAGLPGAQPKEGFDFAVMDLVVDQAGNGSGTIAPAARMKVEQGALVVDDYGTDVVRLESVKRMK